MCVHVRRVLPEPTAVDHLNAHKKGAQEVVEHPVPDVEHPVPDVQGARVQGEVAAAWANNESTMLSRTRHPNTNPMMLPSRSHGHSGRRRRCHRGRRALLPCVCMHFSAYRPPTQHLKKKRNTNTNTNTKNKKERIYIYIMLRRLLAGSLFKGLPPRCSGVAFAEPPMHRQPPQHYYY